MGEKIFGSQGTPEKIKKAERIMTEKQRALSKIKEVQFKSLEKMGKQGYLELSEKGYIVGNINGHKIELNTREGIGTVDDIYISYEDVKRLQKKYTTYSSMGTKENFMPTSKDISEANLDMKMRNEEDLSDQIVEELLK